MDKYSLVPLDEAAPPELLPVRNGFLAFGFKGRFQGRRQGFIQCLKHFSSIGKAFFRIYGKSFFQESDKGRARPFNKFMISLWRPVKGPAGQTAGQKFVQDQADGETVASVGGFAVGLFRGDVTGCSEFIDGFGPSLNLQADAEITKGGMAVWKQENIGW